MVKSPYECKILEWDDKPQTNKQNILSFHCYTMHKNYRSNNYVNCHFLFYDILINILALPFPEGIQYIYELLWGIYIMYLWRPIWVFLGIYGVPYELL